MPAAAETLRSVVALHGRCLTWLSVGQHVSIHAVEIRPPAPNTNSFPVQLQGAEPPGCEGMEDRSADQQQEQPAEEVKCLAFEKPVADVKR